MTPRAARALSAVLLAAAFQAAAAADPGPPSAPTGLARFTDHALVLGAKTSPKGTYLAIAGTRGGRQVLLILRTATMTPAGNFNPAGDSAVGRFEWASDERLVVELVDHDGTLAAPVARGEIFAVNADGTGGRLVFGFRAGGGSTGTHIRTPELEANWGNILDTLRDDDRHILVAGGTFHEANDKQMMVWKVDVVSGLRERIALGPLPNCSFLTDAGGALRLAYGADADHRLRFFLREPAGWQEVRKIAGLPDGAQPWGYLAEGEALLVESKLPVGWGLHEVPLGGGPPRLLARTRLTPTDRWVSDGATGRVLAVRSMPDLPEWTVLDRVHPLGKAFSAVLEEYAGWDVELTSATADGRQAVVAISGDQAPPQYHLLDVATGKLRLVVASRPWITPSEMATVEAFHVAASDGLPIHGYLTLPPGSPASPPLVLLAHGGPHGVRDVWGFDWEAQLLASQGFAVLQVNYRGSGGYGSAYEEAGHRRWGDRMVDDVLDAARWAIRKGKVDGGRVCAMGSSFGAYAAMQAAIRAPELVRCAVGISGVYDLTRMLRTGDIALSGIGRGYLKKALGEDEAQLEAFSPVFNAARLKAAVLLAHGGQDQRTPLDHAEALRDALAKAGRPPEWLVESQEGHGFFDEGARRRLYARVVDFLTLHTPRRPAAASPPAR